MPRFEPGLEEGLALSTARLVNAAYDVETVDEGRLTKPSKSLLVCVRDLRSAGTTREEVIAKLIVPATEADAEHDEALHGFVRDLGLDKARVFCVTTESDNLRMWDTYAAHSTGLVVELQHVHEESTALLAARKVDYAVEPPVIGSGADFFLYGETEELLQASLQAIVATKRVEWSYQSEWRVVRWHREPEGGQFTDDPFHSNELASVRFGAKAAADFREEITKVVAAKYPHCDVRA